MSEASLSSSLRALGRRAAGQVRSLVAGRAPVLPAAETYAPPIAGDDQLARVLETTRQAFRQPALAAALVRGDGVVARAAVGVTVAGGATLVTTRHRFHAGSTTKSLTALLVALLVEERRLSYTTPLARALPGVAMRPEYEQVTLHDLMLNRAGVIPYQTHAREEPGHVAVLADRIPAKTGDPRTQRRLVTAYALAQPPRVAPRTRAVYSNVGWAVVGHVIETALDQPYEAAVAERIFAPLEIVGARFGGWPASSMEPDQPRGHYVEGDGRRPQPLDDPYELAAWMNPAGGLHCSIDDFARYALEILRGLRGDGRLLPRAAHEVLHTVHARERAGTLYQGTRSRHPIPLGYGWGIAPVGAARLSVADGSAGTFYARLAVLPALDVAFAGFASAGDGAAALGDAIGRTTGIPWG